MKILVIGYGEIAEEFAKANKDVEILGIRRNKHTELSNVKIVHYDYTKGIPEVAKNFGPDWIFFFPKTKNRDVESYKEGFLGQLETICNLFPTSKKIFFSSDNFPPKRDHRRYPRVLATADCPQALYSGPCHLK